MTSLSFVQCMDVNDTPVLSASPNVECFTSRHKVFAFAFLLVFIIITVSGGRGELAPRVPMCVYFFLIRRSHSISFTRAQGTPKYKIGFGRGKGWESWGP